MKRTSIGLAAVAALALPLAAQAATQTFTTPGSHSWTVPPGVTHIRVQALGGGGGGGDGVANDGQSASGGPGGLVTSGNLSVTPGQTLTIVVGGGGGASGELEGMGQGGGGGGASSVQVGSTWIVAGGGGGGSYYNDNSVSDTGGWGQG
ncbi:MAG TPA: hypothetical protein PK242_02110, partial [Ottowia sp.]|nr:hypothetical protein [Ottowia sp.]